MLERFNGEQTFGALWIAIQTKSQVVGLEWGIHLNCFEYEVFVVQRTITFFTLGKLLSLSWVENLESGKRNYPLNFLSWSTQFDLWVNNLSSWKGRWAESTRKWSCRLIQKYRLKRKLGEWKVTLLGPKNPRPDYAPKCLIFSQPFSVLSLGSNKCPSLASWIC